MLGIFKGKQKDKGNVNEKKGRTKIEKEEKKYSLKKSKSQDKNDKEKQKQDKGSRFSFKRSKSLDKKKNKDGLKQGNLFSVSSTPSLVNGKELSNETQNDSLPADDTDKEDESETQSSYTVSSSDIASNNLQDTSISYPISSSSNYTDLSSTNQCSDNKSESSFSSSTSQLSEKYSNTAKFHSKNNSFPHHNSKKCESTLNTADNSFNSPCVVRKTNSQSSINESTLKSSILAGDGSISMISTPSSSTSSLSSISGRPISPSGRGTPPCPKLGTGGRMPSSPTMIRKTVRTNIKTNPTASNRRMGSLSPNLSALSLSIESESSNYSNKSPKLRIETDLKPSSESLPPKINILKPKETGTSPTVSPAEIILQPPQSPSSSSIGRSRLSVSSMQSLESIPENGNDTPIPNVGKTTLLSSRKLQNRKIPSSGRGENNPKPDQISKIHNLNDQNDSVSGKQDGNENIACREKEMYENMQTKYLREDDSQTQAKTVISRKPPLKPKLKLSLTTDNLNNGKYESSPKSSLGTVKQEEDQTVVEKSKNISSNERNTSKTEENTKTENKVPETDEPATHVIFRIPLSTSSSTSKSMRRATSLEIIPSRCDKLLPYKEDIFPRSPSPVRAITRKRKCSSVPKILSSKGETDVKFEIPITLDELKKQAAILSRSINVDSFPLAVREEPMLEPIIKKENAKQLLYDTGQKETENVENSRNLSRRSPARISSERNISIENKRKERDDLEHEVANETEILVIENRETKLKDNTSANETCNNIIEISETDNSDSAEIIKETIKIKIDEEELNKGKECNQETESSKPPVMDQSIQACFEDFLENEACFLNFKKELAEQEQKYQNQIDGLTMKLATKQQEVVDLADELAEARERSLRNPREEALQIEIEDLKKQIKLKENIAESIRVELEYKKNETEISKMRTARLEEELNKAKEMIESLQETNNLRNRESSRLREFESKVKNLEEELRKSEATRKDLQESLNDIETERDEELKIVQDALDEAAQEREELIVTFEKELKQLNTTNTAREQQMMEDFEWKLREMEKEHKKKMEEKERQLESTLQRVKSHGDDEDFRQKIEKMKNEMNSKWEDKLRSECSRLKAELDDLHAEEKHLAVESMKVQKEQEIHNLKKSYELTQEEMTKKISTLKDKLTERDAQHHKEVESQRAMFDRDIWDLRMKLQKLNESSFDKQQQMEEKYKDEMERFRVDYEDRIRELEKKVAAREAEAGIDLLGQLEKEHREQMQHLEEQHKISMERLREELESDKFQAVEEARVIITKHHEYVESSLKDQVTEYMNIANQYRDELDSLRKGLGLPRREGDDPSLAPPSGLSSSQFSLSSSSDSQGSRTSQDRFYLPENTGVLDGSDDSQKGNPGLLGKVFGGGWFSQSKSSSRRGSTPSANKKPLS